MRRLLSVLCLVALPLAAEAGIEKDAKEKPPEGGIAVPKGAQPLWLECWFDDRRVVIERDPAGFAAGDLPRTVVVRRDDGRVTTLRIPGDRIRGCVPLAR